MYDESISKLKREVYRESTGPASVSSVAATNSYNMGGKWIAQLIVPLGPVVSNKRSILSAFEESDETPKDFKRIFLGRYDYEEEANAVLRIAKQEWSSTGIFVPRRLAPPQKPGAYLSQSSQSHGGPQSYSYNSQGPMRPSPQQYSNVPSVQGKVYYPDPKVPHHTSQSTGQRPQSMQPATSLPQTQVNTQFGYYQPYLQPRGAPQPVHASQTPTNVMPYLPAPPKSHLQYPLQRPGDPLPSSFPSQTFQPYASSGHHLHRANTSPNYPTDPSSVLPSPDGQVFPIHSVYYILHR